MRVVGCLLAPPRYVFLVVLCCVAALMRVSCRLLSRCLPPTAVRRCTAHQLCQPPASLLVNPFHLLGGVDMRDPLGLQKRRAAASAAANGESLGSTAWLVVGLGNPGGTYRGTRHNVGFELIDRLGEQVGIAVDKKEKKFKALVGSGDVDGRRVVLIKPTTYMNLSGDSVMLVAGHYKIPMSRTIILHDDLDLPLGKLRLRQKGSHGGHNGLRSIIQRNKGRSEFPRLKIGIGRPDHPNVPISAWVLGKFDSHERPELDHVLDEGVSAVRAVIVLGMEKAMSGQRL